MSDKPDRETLLRETHRLYREIGYAGFRLEYFNDADVIKEWPDPTTRERELRAIWSGQAEQAYPSYREQFADVRTADLAALRDHLGATLAGSRIDHADFYHRASEAGRRARFQQRDQANDLEPLTPAPGVPTMSDQPPHHGRSEIQYDGTPPAADAESRERMADAQAYAESVGLPSPEAWQQLKAEWTHDYGLRRMEDRGVRYEDQKNRALDRAQDRAAARPEPATPDPASRARFQERDPDRGAKR